MTYLQPFAQVILVVIFAFGGAIRFLQPIDVLTKRMRWVSYFSPRVVRSIALVEVFCGVGVILHFLFPELSFSFLLYSGYLLIATMIGAAITHFVIGDYREIFGNVCLIGLIYYATISVG
jgi:hypothetical protein